MSSLLLMGPPPDDAVIVVDDHTPETAQRLRSALELQRRHPALRIAVMRYVPAGPEPPAAPERVLASLPDTLTFEYDV